MANRVSVPGGVGISGKRPAVGPDWAPFVLALPELKHAARRLNELMRRGHEHNPRETLRITLQNRVIPARSASWSVSGLLNVEPGLRPRRHRRHILVVHYAIRAAASLVLPDSGQVAFW